MSPFSSYQRRLIRVQLAERDGWVCWICARALPHDPAVNDPAAASIDHVVPLAAGGSSELGNLRLAHRGCNERRGVQLQQLTVADRLRMRDFGMVVRHA